MNKFLVKMIDGDKYTAWQIPDAVMMFYNSGIGYIQVCKYIDKELHYLTKVIYNGITNLKDNEYFQHNDIIYTLKCNDRLIASLEER